MNVVVNLVLQVPFLSQALKNVLLGCSRNAARCEWGKVAVMVWAVNLPVLHDKGPIGSAYTLLN